MPAPAYSKRLLAGIIPAGGPALVSAPVPAGKLWIVNEISFVVLTSTGNFLLVHITGGLYLYSIGLGSLAGTTIVNMHQVMEPGEQITAELSAFGADTSILISGYELFINP
jgi:hypothetical protein